MQKSSILERQEGVKDNIVKNIGVSIKMIVYNNMMNIFWKLILPISIALCWVFLFWQCTKDIFAADKYPPRDYEYQIDTSSRESVRSFALFAGKGEERVPLPPIKSRATVGCKLYHAGMTDQLPEDVEAGLAGFFVFSNGKSFALCYGPAKPDYVQWCALVGMKVAWSFGTSFACYKGGIL